MLSITLILLVIITAYTTFNLCIAMNIRHVDAKRAALCEKYMRRGKLADVSNYSGWDTDIMPNLKEGQKWH
jgi:hypothetical protein